MTTAPKFGGNWTREKLTILDAYLDAYTSALKKQHFELVYIDAFAGSGGYFSTNDNGFKEFHRGSVSIALDIRDKEFDSFVFVEKSKQRHAALETLKAKHRNRRIELVNDDANTFLNGLGSGWDHKRGVLFLDPFGTQVDWSTIEKISSLNALDLWILFPVSAVARLLPLQQEPDAIDIQWTERLNSIYGNERWRDLYQPLPHVDLIDGRRKAREGGTKKLLDIYKEQLRSCFGNRYLDNSRSLKHTNGSTLFELIFCAGHPRGAKVAKRIARHIVEFI